MLKSKVLRQRVEKYLIALPHCRDDDNKLIANIWQDELVSKHGENYDKMSARDLLFHFSRKHLSSPESIRRMRQKIQELHPMLRGTTYQQRQRHQSKVKQEIRAFS